MKSCITLIGMPGAGKSVIGRLLATQLDLEFVDTDLLIEHSHGMPLQNILDGKGYLALRQIEENQILAMTPNKQVIATGGSAVYSDKAMRFLKRCSTVIFLDIDLDTARQRIHNFDQRGIARAPEQTIEMIFKERYILYKKYADIRLSSAGENPGEIVDAVLKSIANN